MLTSKKGLLQWARVAEGQPYRLCAKIDRLYIFLITIFYKKVNLDKMS